MRITIYQLIAELDIDRLLFQNLAYMKRCGYQKVPSHLYESVFDGDVDIKNCSDVFRMFNRVTEDDARFLESIGFQGHSLSVSDVVEFHHSPSSSRFYFCDSLCFEEIEFDKNKAMMTIVNHDYEPLRITRNGTYYVCFNNDFGMEIYQCSEIALERCQYSQCQLGYRLSYESDGKDGVVQIHKKDFLDHPKVLLFSCEKGKPPKDLLYQSAGSNLWLPKYPAHSIENIKLVESWCRQYKISYEYL